MTTSQKKAYVSGSDFIVYKRGFGRSYPCDGEFDIVSGYVRLIKKKGCSAK
jgi:hypothetical protein